MVGVEDRGLFDLYSCSVYGSGGALVDDLVVAAGPVQHRRSRRFAEEVLVFFACTCDLGQSHVWCAKWSGGMAIGGGFFCDLGID